MLLTSFPCLLYILQISLTYHSFGLNPNSSFVDVIFFPDVSCQIFFTSATFCLKSLLIFCFKVKVVLSFEQLHPILFYIFILGQINLMSIERLDHTGHLTRILIRKRIIDKVCVILLAVNNINTIITQCPGIPILIET